MIKQKIKNSMLFTKRFDVFFTLWSIDYRPVYSLLDTVYKNRACKRTHSHFSHNKGTTRVMLVLNLTVKVNNLFPFDFRVCFLDFEISPTWLKIAFWNNKKREFVWSWCKSNLANILPKQIRWIWKKSYWSGTEERKNKVYLSRMDSYHQVTKL